jgi:hypothetical protein
VTPENRSFNIEFDKYSQAIRLTPSSPADGFTFSYMDIDASRKYVVLTNKRVAKLLLRGDYVRVPEVEGYVYKLAR